MNHPQTDKIRLTQPAPAWSNEVRFKVCPPSDGKAYRYDLECTFHGRVVRWQNIDDTSTRFRAFVAWVRRKLGL